MRASSGGSTPPPPVRADPGCLTSRHRGWRSSLRLRSVAQAVSVDPSQERPRHLRIFSCPSSPHPRRALSSCRTPAEPSTHHTELTVPRDQDCRGKMADSRGPHLTP
ncbi:Spoc Domain-Containing Protein 1 [Manis pentadactyla]|nr:Spoc Domain-Containing Protein 1 [Manis pentadactyla]